MYRLKSDLNLLWALLAGPRDAKASLYFFEVILKAIAYIDGQNFYHALNRLKINGHHFNYRDFVREYTDRKELMAIKYYGAIYPGSVDEVKSNRDDAFYKHLQMDQKIQIKLGHFKINKIKGEKIPYEKGVDVRLATDLIFDALYGNYDVAYVFSNDTDLIPAITETIKRFGVSITNVTLSRTLIEFKDACTHTIKAYDSVVKRHAKYNEFKPSKETLNDLKEKYNGKRC